MGIPKPETSYLIQENDSHIEVEDGNNLEDSKGNGGLIVEHQVIGTAISPLLASILIFLMVGIMATRG